MMHVKKGGISNYCSSNKASDMCLRLYKHEDRCNQGKFAFAREV